MKPQFLKPSIVISAAILLTSCAPMQSGRTRYYDNDYGRARLNDENYEGNHAREQLERERRWNEDRYYYGY